MSVSPALVARAVGLDRCGFRWSDGWGAHVCHYTANHASAHRCDCDAEHQRSALSQGPPIVTLLDLLAAIQRVAGGVTAWQLPYVVDRRTGRRLPTPPTHKPKRRKR